MLFDDLMTDSSGSSSGYYASSMSRSSSGGNNHNMEARSTSTPPADKPKSSAYIGNLFFLEGRQLKEVSQNTVHVR